jgi:S-adenosylmethionine decarboxylase
MAENNVVELIVDAYGCQLDLSDPQRFETAARNALESEGATVVKTSFYQFQPHGLTLCLILKESHFIVSTWPEFKMVVVNIFLCNRSMDPKRVWSAFAKCLLPSSVKFHEVDHHLGSSLSMPQGGIE